MKIDKYYKVKSHGFTVTERDPNWDEGFKGPPVCPECKSPDVKIVTVRRDVCTDSGSMWDTIQDSRDCICNTCACEFVQFGKKTYVSDDILQSDYRKGVAIIAAAVINIIVSVLMIIFCEEGSWIATGVLALICSLLAISFSIDMYIT